MPHKVKYIVKKNFHEEDSLYVLKAKFRFPGHLFKKDYGEIQKRMAVFQEEGELSQYLIKKEGLNYYGSRGGSNSAFFEDGRREVKISRPYLEECFLSFGLKVCVKGNFPLKKLFNLDALDKFVLFGK